MTSAENDLVRPRSYADLENSQRYYLHHHAPKHNQHRPRNSFSRVSTTGLSYFKNTHKNSTAPNFQNTIDGLRIGAARSHSTTQLSTMSQVTTSLVKAVVRGHALSPATCTRLRQPCETCQHSVHKHGYLYCLHCPVVCHFREECFKNIPRSCPSLEIDIKGWGESRHPIKFVRNPTIELEDVFLSGMLGLQANKCHECGHILNPSSGHDFPSNDSKVSSDENGKHAKHHGKKGKSNTSHASNEKLEIRVCHFTGKYYCSRCHWNDHWYIPGSVFVLNDTSLQPVCRSAYLKLRVLWDSAVYRVPTYWSKENPEASQVFEVRTRLQRLYRFTLSCSNASAIRECSEMSEPAYLLGHPHYFRMCDVIELLKGNLYPRLHRHLEIWTEHISTCDQCILESGVCLQNNDIFASRALENDLSGGRLKLH